MNLRDKKKLLIGFVKHFTQNKCGSLSKTRPVPLAIFFRIPSKSNQVIFIFTWLCLFFFIANKIFCGMDGWIDGYRDKPKKQYFFQSSGHKKYRV